MTVAVVIALAAVVSGGIAVGWLRADGPDSDPAALQGSAKIVAESDRVASPAGPARPAPRNAANGVLPPRPVPGAPGSPGSPGPQAGSDSEAEPAEAQPEAPATPLSNPGRSNPVPQADANVSCRPPAQPDVTVDRAGNDVSRVVVSGFDLPCVGEVFTLVLDMRSGGSIDVEVTVSEDRALVFQPESPVDARDVRGVRVRPA